MLSVSGGFLYLECMCNIIFSPSIPTLTHFVDSEVIMALWRGWCRAEETGLTLLGHEFWAQCWPHHRLCWPIKHVVNLLTVCLTRSIVAASPSPGRYRARCCHWQRLCRVHLKCNSGWEYEGSAPVPNGPPSHLKYSLYRNYSTFHCNLLSCWSII